MNKVLRYNVADYRKKRVIIDTDAACEGDDPFAIAEALLSKMLDIRAITAEHFVSEGSMEKSFEICQTITEKMGSTVPVLHGQTGPLSKNPEEPLSEASAFIIEEALREDSHPLFLLCLGAITNVAKALLARPEIKDRMTIVWIGCNPFDSPNPGYEFNSGNDIAAANTVLMSGGDLWVIPNTVYGTMHIGFAEIERRIAPCGEIGHFLYDNLIRFYESDAASWSAGESWSLGDSPAVGVCLEPNCGGHVRMQVPHINDDLSYSHPENAPYATLYTSVNSRFILEDLMCKLELCFPPRK